MEEVKFIYDEAAAVVYANGQDHLVIGDLHIGAERSFIRKGIRMYGVIGAMILKIKKLSTDFGTKNLIILGDVKDTVLYPDSVEGNELKTFFKELSDFDITITRGNHDPHLEEIVNCKMVDELCIGGFAFMHGHRWPSDAAMRSKMLFAGHNHIAISMRDKNKGFYGQKAWLVSKVNAKNASERYPKLNKKINLVVLPAFNDLILGMPVNEALDENLSPLFRNKVFDYKNAKVFSLRGEPVGTPSRIEKNSKQK